MVTDGLELDEFLSESELLSRRDLIAPDVRTAGELRVGVACGRPLSAVSPQARGDGQFTVLPSGVDESAVIPALFESLASDLASADFTGDWTTVLVPIRTEVPG